MGRKNVAEEKAAEQDEKVEMKDPPIVVAMKEVDDRYLVIEKELEKEIAALRRQYRPKLEPLLAERRKLLSAPAQDAGDDSEAGKATPSCRGFWLTALKRLPSTTDEIEAHDAEVLEYLSDVRAADLDPEDEAKGFKIEFEFVENPFMTNSVVTVEFHSQQASPYSSEFKCSHTKATEIEWKAGKNVTVEKVAKKKTGGGAKKKKQKETEEPRDSFFRSTFRNLKVGDDIPEDIASEEMMGQFDDEDEFVQEYLDNQMEIFRMVKDNLIPHAVYVYTGQAFPSEDDDDDEDEESEEEDEDDDDDSEDEAPKAKAKAKPKAKKGGAGGGGDQAKEECKQQ